jgi:hypothetical protein
MPFENTVRWTVRWTVPMLCVGSMACTSDDGAALPGVENSAPSTTETTLAPQTLTELARERARALLGAEHQKLELVDDETEEFPLSGRKRHRYVFHSQKSGELRAVSLDGSGKAVEDHELYTGERLARFARYGHLRPRFAARLEHADQNELHEAVVFLPVSDDPSPAELAHAQRRLLDAVGEAEFVPASDGSPWASLRVSAGTLRWLARSDLVGAIFDAKGKRRVPLSNANHYELSNIVAAHNTYGALGSNVRVATVGEYVPPHPNLPFDPFGAKQRYPMKSPAGPSLNGHGSLVMGYIANTNPADLEDPPPSGAGSKRGVAPLATLYNSSGIEVVGTFLPSSVFRPVAGMDGRSWQPVTAADAFSSNDEVWQALPSASLTHDTADYELGPRLDYTLNFNITGRYYIWVRGKCIASACGSSDSLHVGLDRTLTTTSDRLDGYGSSFTWRSASNDSGTRPYFNVGSTGNHTISVWMREDGFTFDALVITPDASFTPTEDLDVPTETFARDNDAHPMSEYAWLSTQGVQVANLSMGSTCSDDLEDCEPDISDQIADFYATHGSRILTVRSSGNIGDDDDTYGFVGTNMIYNGLVVGGAQPKCYTTPGSCTGGWASHDRTLDHTVANYVYQNPPNKPRWELPHLTAYARGVHDSVGTSQEVTGTSVAAPQVAGAAALVLSNNGPHFVGHPEAVKAVLMAGADVNTDLNSPSLGATYSYMPSYISAPLDRHGGVGLLNVEASVEISRATRKFMLNNRQGLPVESVTGGLPREVLIYQRSIPGTSPPATLDLNAGTRGGFDVGIMDPELDFIEDDYKHLYYFRPTVAGNLRIAFVWNFGFSCRPIGTTARCLSFEPIVDMVLRDMHLPEQYVARSSGNSQPEKFLAATVIKNRLYRLEFSKRGDWNSPVPYGIAIYLTANPQ